MPKSKPKHSEEQSPLIPAIERLLTEQTSTILEAVDTRLVAQEKRLDEHLAAQDQRIEARFAAQEKHIEERLIAQDIRRTSNDPGLFDQAQQLARTLDWKNDSLTLWEIVLMAGDEVRARQLLDAAFIEIVREYQQGHGLATEMSALPETMTQLGLRLKDQRLLEQARQEVRNVIDPSLRADALRTVAAGAAKPLAVAGVRETPRPRARLTILYGTRKKYPHILL